MQDQKNMILAIGLSMAVILAWQFFVGMPQIEKQKQEAQLRQQQTQAPAPGAAQSMAAPATIAAPRRARRRMWVAALITIPRPTSPRIETTAPERGSGQFGACTPAPP